MGPVTQTGVQLQAAGADAPRVGMIGLGIMGGAMARNLVIQGFRVVGFDPDPARGTEAAANGVDVLASAAAVAGRSEVILATLPSAKALEETAAAIAAEPTRRPGLVVAELSTLSLEAKQAAHDRLAAAGVTLLDCALSGTGPQAVTGDIAVYASGDQAACERCRSVFNGFSRTHYYLGAFGNGTKTKFVANLMVAIHNVAAAEAVVLAKRAGLDLSTLRDVIASGGGTSRMFEVRAPLMVADTYTPPTMKLDLWQKDMSLIGAFARSLGVYTPLFSATAPLYQEAIAGGRGHEDTAAVCAIIEQHSTPPPRS
jgi:3-hydroxyisobutyrate dehydrogenase-like beta-hydroxyacid dehydrogenase